MRACVCGGAAGEEGLDLAKTLLQSRDTSLIGNKQLSIVSRIRDTFAPVVGQCCYRKLQLMMHVQVGLWANFD